MYGSESRAALNEVVAMTALFLSYIWLWQESFQGHRPAFVLMFLALGAYSHARRGETLRDIGIRLENFLHAARVALPYVAPLAIVPVLIGAMMGTLNPEVMLQAPAKLPWKTVTATAQQYGLLAFYYRRLAEILPGSWKPVFAAASIFAFYHLPNPFLTILTLFTGSLACWLYRRTSNLLVLGVSHAVASYAISCSLPDYVTFGMRVGPGFFKVWGDVQRIF